MVVSVVVVVAAHSRHYSVRPRWEKIVAECHDRCVCDGVCVAVCGTVSVVVVMIDACVWW